VDKNGVAYWRAPSRDIAQDIENHFRHLGVQANPGGGDDETVCVYLYKK